MAGECDVSSWVIYKKRNPTSTRKSGVVLISEPQPEFVLCFTGSFVELRNKIEELSQQNSSRSERERTVYLGMLETTWNLMFGYQKVAGN